MSLKQGVFLCSLCLLVVLAACRRNAPSLVDTNEAPDTELWHSPPDSTEYEYLVHMYWRGTDRDGTVEEYIWTIQDTLVLGEQSWNPADRLADLRSGRRTTRTDSIFSFTAFKDIGGVGVKKNRQAFHIASIDDNGVIDSSPAALEFVAVIDRLPEIRFTTVIGGVPRPYRVVTGQEAPDDTVGMFEPFDISYHGITTNGQVRGYRWRPLSTTLEIPGADIWTEDLGDTLRTFPNAGNEVIPSSTFRFAAQCIDDANAESAIDAGQFRAGVCQVVVNFDPDTRFTEVWNSYTVNDVVTVRQINFQDAIPDTVSYQSWLTMRYQGWDDPRDSKLCSPTNPDSCIDFQVGYLRTSSRVAGSSAKSGWLPRGAFHDTDLGSATDSNTVNIGSLEYSFQARAVDETGLDPDSLAAGSMVRDQIERADGTPAELPIIGNFDPTLDTYSLLDEDGIPLNLATIDTVTWDFWNPLNADTIEFDLDAGTINKKKVYQWSIQGTGHDHPWEPDGSGLKSWRYFVFSDFGGPNQRFWPLARAGETWVAGAALDFLDEVFQLTFRYDVQNFGDPFDDPNGDGVFDNLPGYFDEDLTVVLVGRDTATDEPSFEQFVFLNGVRELINSFPAASFGRYTTQATFTFHFRMER